MRNRVQPLTGERTPIGVRQRRHPLKQITLSLLAAALAAVIIAPRTGRAADQTAAPVFVTRIPPGYRDWKFVSVSHEEGNLHSIGAVLGNDIALKAYRDGKLPFPDGAIIAALHYRHTPSEENDKVFGQAQSFVAGAPTNIQFMVKDSTKYAATGGWGFAFFIDGKPVPAASMKSCYPCHAKAPATDLVFTRYAP